jgi:hypothetical protein
MRIISESDAREQVDTSLQGPTESGRMTSLDGGAPSAMLLRALAETLPISVEMGMARAGVDAGPPPKWLVGAIQAVAAHNRQLPSGDIDAGPAPNPLA